jgi:hypothetical protein
MMLAVAMEAGAMETTVVESSGVATVEGRRTVRHTRCESHGDCAGEKLFSH